jgi:hypothetical protein
MEQWLPVALFGAAVGGVAPWPLKAAWRLARGDSERAERHQEAEAKREAAELERLLTEIARLSARHGELEELVDLLRRELDKALVRGNATMTMARILLFAVDQHPHPTAAMIAARDQARRVIAAADDQIKRGG